MYAFVSPPHLLFLSQTQKISHSNSHVTYKAGISIESMPAKVKTGRKITALPATLIIYQATNFSFYFFWESRDDISVERQMTDPFIKASAGRDWQLIQDNSCSPACLPSITSVSSTQPCSFIPLFFGFYFFIFSQSKGSYLSVRLFVFRSVPCISPACVCVRAPSLQKSHST